jgi:hypothetical protein
LADWTRIGFLSAQLMRVSLTKRRVSKPDDEAAN